VVKRLLILLLALCSSLFAESTGTFTLGPLNTTDCQSGFTCCNFAVDCPNIIEPGPAAGIIADWKSDVPARGLVIFFGGHDGSGWWNVTPLSQVLFDVLHNAGFEIVQVRWPNGWPFSNGYPQGFEDMACRPATVIQWVHDNWFAALDLIRTPGRAGYAVVGGSEGGAAIAYSISNYGLDGLIDVLIPISGPPMAAIAPGCLNNPAYAYVVPGETTLIDEPWGYGQGQCGPCCQHDLSWTQTWIQNSVETGGTNYFYPTTRVHFIEGLRDERSILYHGFAFYQVLLNNHQPMLTWEFVPTMPHSIQHSVEGLIALYAALIQ